MIDYEITNSQKILLGALAVNMLYCFCNGFSKYKNKYFSELEKIKDHNTNSENEFFKNFLIGIILLAISKAKTSDFTNIFGLFILCKLSDMAYSAGSSIGSCIGNPRIQNNDAHLQRN